MTTIEDRLRAATRAAAETVAPGSAPPLHLPDRPARRRRHWWANWITPLAAAAAVTAVIAGTVTISSAIHGRTPRHPSVPARQIPPVPSGQVPPYYVALVFSGSGACCGRGQIFAPRTHAVVRSTKTGAVLATIAAPKPYGTFAGVAAADDDRTFVLAAWREGRMPEKFTPRPSYPPATKFFLLHINPAAASATGRATLTPLPISEPTGTDVANFALSPQGDSLAVGVTTGVQVFSVATGAQRAWSTPISVSFPYALGTGATNGMLAWQDDHTLAFVWDGLPKKAMGVRFLDTSAPGRDGLADSRLVQPRRLIGTSYWRQVLPTADGSKLLTVLQVQGTKAYPHLSLQLAVCSARTGKILRILNRVRAVAGTGDYEQVLWASPSGDKLIVAGTRRVGNRPQAPFFLPSPVLLTPGHTRPIPWSNRTIGAAW